MKIIACVDDRLGMMFNHRRQSRDRYLLDDVKNDLGDTVLRISPYSEKLLSGSGIRYVIAEDPFLDAGTGSVIFVEDKDPLPYLSDIDEITLYRWNRKYPYDVALTIPLSEFRLIISSEFEGYSHEKITKDIYKK